MNPWVAMPPPASPLTAYRERNSPRWGLRLALLLVVVAGGLVAGRRYVPAIDARVTPVLDVAESWLRRAEWNPLGHQRPAADSPQTAAPRRPAIVPIEAAPVEAARAAVPAAAPAAVAPRPTAPKQAPPEVHADAAPRPARRTVAIAASVHALAPAPRSRPAPAAAPAPVEKPVAAAPAPAPAAPVEKPAAPEEKKPVAARAPEPEAPAPSNPGDPLEALMATATKHKPARRGGTVDRELAGFDKKSPEAKADRAGEAAAKPAEPVRNQLSRSDIQTVMRDVQDKAGACYRQYQIPGTVDAKITVAPDGSVSAVSLGGPFSGTPTGQCVEKLVKAAAFPASSGLRFDYRIPVR
jgi:hypothetical protein